MSITTRPRLTRYFGLIALLPRERCYTSTTCGHSTAIRTMDRYALSAIFAHIARTACSFHSTPSARQGNVLSIVEKLLNTEWNVRVDGMAFAISCNWGSQGTL